MLCGSYLGLGHIDLGFVFSREDVGVEKGSGNNWQLVIVNFRTFNKCCLFWLSEYCLKTKAFLKRKDII